MLHLLGAVDENLMKEAKSATIQRFSSTISTEAKGKGVKRYIGGQARSDSHSSLLSYPVCVQIGI